MKQKRIVRASSKSSITRTQSKQTAKKTNKKKRRIILGIGYP